MMSAHEAGDKNLLKLKFFAYSSVFNLPIRFSDINCKRLIYIYLVDDVLRTFAIQNLLSTVLS